MILTLSLQIVIKRSRTSIIVPNRILMQMIHVVPVIVVSDMVNVRCVQIVTLLVVTDHVLHVTHTDPENHIYAVLELTLTENLCLVQHLEVTA